MPKKDAKIDSKLLDVVQLISEEEVSQEVGEAFASYMLNPTVVWAKFILTDDRTNANGQRIPEEEFANLIRSGIHMPVKMANGEIKEGHENSKPLGVITHLKKILTQGGANAIVALAALWGEERPADVGFIKEKFSSGEPVNVSWEILFEDSHYNAETSSEDLENTSLRAATIVGNPAYMGRTPFLSVAAKKWSNAYINELPDSSFLYIDRDGNKYFPIADTEGRLDNSKIKEALSSLGKSNLPMPVIRENKKRLSSIIEKLESGKSVGEVSREFIGDSQINVEEEKVDKTQAELQADNEVLQAKLEKAEANVTQLEGKLTEKEQELNALKQTNETQETELVTLREFKAEIDAETEKAEKLDKVKSLFVEAGIEKDDEFYVENAEKLVSLDEAALDFMVQELKAFAEASSNNSAEASKKAKKIPALGSEDKGEVSREELIEYLRKNAKK